jgi:hypothetical protein
VGAPFLYWRLRVPTGGMRGARALHESAVRPWAVFTSQIGTPADEVVAITPGQQADVDAGVTSRLVVAGVEPIAATVRPLTSEPLTASAVYAHRWFDIAEKDWPEFLSLSEGAWPGFEKANPGVRIEGFFRSEAVTSPDARVLLVTRYPSLAAWEQSRNATDEAGGANFRRRHEITRKTVVATFRLLAP